MITFEEAYRIAKTRKPVIVSCIENNNAYIFNGNEELYEGLSPAIVMKKTGKLTYMAYYSYMSEIFGTPTMIRTIPIEMYFLRCVLNEVLSKKIADKNNF